MLDIFLFSMQQREMVQVVNIFFFNAAKRSDSGGGYLSFGEIWWRKTTKPL